MLDEHHRKVQLLQKVDKQDDKAESGIQLKQTQGDATMMVNPSTGVDMQNIIEQMRSAQQAANVNQPPQTPDAKTAAANQNQMNGKTPQGDYTFSVYA